MLDHFVDKRQVAHMLRAVDEDEREPVAFRRFCGRSRRCRSIAYIRWQAYATLTVAANPTSLACWTRTASAAAVDVRLYALSEDPVDARPFRWR